MTFLGHLATGGAVQVRAGDPCVGRLRHPGEKWEGNVVPNVDPPPSQLLRALGSLQTPCPYASLKRLINTGFKGADSFKRHLKE